MDLGVNRLSKLNVSTHQQLTNNAASDTKTIKSRLAVT
jgi:hypothetical protein